MSLRLPSDPANLPPRKGRNGTSPARARTSPAPGSYSSIYAAAHGSLSRLKRELYGTVAAAERERYGR